jgi:uncharacterized membrane protein YjjP (DUF1212 family)
LCSYGFFNSGESVCYSNECVRIGLLVGDTFGDVFSTGSAGLTTGLDSTFIGSCFSICFKIHYTAYLIVSFWFYG